MYNFNFLLDLPQDKRDNEMINEEKILPRHIRIRPSKCIHCKMKKRNKNLKKPIPYYEISDNV